jgi:bifunctional non-homologous end joining protein LigD
MPTKVIKPMMATAAAELPTGPDWTYEVKWDGYRTMAVKDGQRVTLISRNLKDVTAQYPPVSAAVAALAARSATLDGELVALDENGRPSFQALQHRATSVNRIVLYAFDLLTLNGEDLSRRPLDERRAALSRVVAGSPVLLSEPLPGTADDISRAVRSLGLEGVVAKRRSSIYEPGKRSDAWVKVRFAKRQEFVVGGYKRSDRNFDSILVGYYDARLFMYAGKVRAGFTPHTRADLFARIERLETDKCPFVNLPSSRTSHWGEGITAEDMKTLTWVKPIIVVEVAFAEWTRDGNLRHASFAGLRSDKAAKDVFRD